MEIPNNILNESIMKYNYNIFECNELMSITIINAIVCYIITNNRIALIMNYQGIAYAIL